MEPLKRQDGLKKNRWEEKITFICKTFTFPQETVFALTLLPITSYKMQKHSVQKH